jgi:hypothetical protein
MDKIKKFINKKQMEKKFKGAGQGNSLQDDGQLSLNTCRQNSQIPQNKVTHKFISS